MLVVQHDGLIGYGVEGLKRMMIEAGITWSHLLRKTFGQVARAINRAKGPAKKAAEVEELKWREACRMETNDTAKGTVRRPA